MMISSASLDLRAYACGSKDPATIGCTWSHSPCHTLHHPAPPSAAQLCPAQVQCETANARRQTRQTLENGRDSTRLDSARLGSTYHHLWARPALDTSYAWRQWIAVALCVLGRDTDTQNHIAAASHTLRTSYGNAAPSMRQQRVGEKKTTEKQKK